MTENRPPLWRRRGVEQIILVVVSAFLSAIVVVGIATREGVPPFRSGQGWLEVLVSVLTLVGAAWAAWLLFVRTEHSERTLVASLAAAQAARFQKGVELLESENEATRAGGIYVLRDLASENAITYWSSVADVLMAFARERSQETRSSMASIAQHDDYPPDYAGPPGGRTGADVLAAVEVLGLKSQALRDAVGDLADAPEFRVLDGVVLRFVELSGLKFDGFSFESVAIEDCSFDTCSFANCRLDIAITDLEFKDCDLAGAEVSLFNLGWAAPEITFRHSNLSGAKIIGQARSPKGLIDTCDVSGLTVFAGRIRIRDSWHTPGSPPERNDNQSDKDDTFDTVGMVARLQNKLGMPVWTRQ